MPMTMLCRKVDTLCFLEIGLELLFCAMPQARTVWQPSSEAREMGPPVLQDRVKAPQHPPTAQAPTAYPGSSAGCQRCCSCPPAEQGQGHTDKVINKDSAEMGTGGKERQEGEESKKKLNKRKISWETASVSTAFSGMCLKARISGVSMALSTPLTLLGGARPVYLKAFCFITALPMGSAALRYLMGELAESSSKECYITYFKLSTLLCLLT